MHTVSAPVKKDGYMRVSVCVCMCVSVWRREIIQEFVTSLVLDLIRLGRHWVTFFLL